jgi:hypothetical protein
MRPQSQQQFDQCDQVEEERGESGESDLKGVLPKSEVLKRK